MRSHAHPVVLYGPDYVDRFALFGKAKYEINLHQDTLWRSGGLIFSTLHSSAAWVLALARVIVLCNFHNVSLRLGAEIITSKFNVGITLRWTS